MPRLLAVLAAGALVLGSGSAAQAAAAPVAVYPIPGTSYNLPRTQIAFRGIPAGQIGYVQVAGSSSGPHTGKIEADSDGNGGSFVPDKPFRGGETVTVTTGLGVIGSSGGKFSFRIEHPSRTLGVMPLPVIPAGSNGLQRFASRPDLLPPSVTVTKNSAPASQGDIFITPQFGPVQNGPMILDPQGKLLWFLPYPVNQNTLISDFRVQRLSGQPVLTWWQGYTNHGAGEGEGVIWDRNYRQIAVVQAGNGLQMDLHEFLITSSGQAWILAVSPVSLPSVPYKPSIDAVVQEIDIKTGLVLFEWHALDHVAPSESQFTPRSPGFVFDPYHANSVGIDRDGNVIVSMRNTSAVYKVDRNTGQVLWRLGGKRSSFRMGRGAATAFQHNAIVQPDSTVTIFDDGAGPPAVHRFSRGIRVALDPKRMTASLIREYDHSPEISAQFEGGVQQLSGGDVFLGWGQQPYFSEDNADGQQIFDAHFTVPTSSYRAYRFPWSGQPLTAPALALSPNPDGSTSLFASWNGATDVSTWRVLGGPSPSSLGPIGSASRSGFETRIVAHSSPPYFAVQALDPAGNALATSPVGATATHIGLYGRSVFVSGGGVGAVPASCFSPHPCSVTATISSGATVIARTGAERIPVGGGGLLYFSLSRAGRSTLAKAKGHRLAVTASARDSSGISASVALTLIPFSSSGGGPRRSASQTPVLQFIGLTEFVSPAGIGGVLSSCFAPVPCGISAKLTVGKTVIATTKPEFLGANELGYVIFGLTPAGRSMLAHARGNQLGAHVTLTSGSNTAGADVALVGFR